MDDMTTPAVPVADDASVAGAEPVVETAPEMAPEAAAEGEVVA